MWRNYLFPGSVEEAPEMLTTYDGGAHLIAGGTGLILELAVGVRLERLVATAERVLMEMKRPG